MSIMTLTNSVCMKYSSLISTNVGLSLQAAGTTTHYLQSITCHLCSFTLWAVNGAEFSSESEDEIGQPSNGHGTILG